MALYTIADLHLPLGIDKPMDIFGSRWTNYVERIHDNWKNIITDNDTVVLPGDFSWATYLEQSIPDFKFIEELPGKKILLKGNHDFWWETMSKLKKFLADNDFKTIDFLQNNAFMYNTTALCGTRGWSYLGSGNASDDDRRIYERELGRLELSLQAAMKQSPEKIIVFMHYPPLTPDIPESGFSELMKKYSVSMCVYGHIHNAVYKNVVEGERNGIKFLLASCDYHGFVPQKLCN